MTWFFIALGAPVLWALVNVADKYLVTNYSDENQSSGALVLFSSLIGIVASILICIFTQGVFDIPFVDKLLLMFAGAFSIVWIILYLFSLEIEDVSSVVPWMLTIPVFGYLIGYIVLGESLASKELIGGGVIILGSIILSIDFSKLKLLFKRKVASLMLLSCIIYAVNGVIFKFVAETDSFWVSSFWEYAGLGLGGVVIFMCCRKYRRAFIANIRTSGMKILWLNIVSEWTTIAGNLLTNYALLIAPVALVYIVGTFQPIVVLVLTALSTRFFPKIVQEDFSIRVLLPKLIAIGIMLLGSVILFI